MRLDWDEAGRLVDEAQKILVLTHVGPDGDAIGSMMGLAYALRDLGKDVITAVDGGVPDPLRFLPGTDSTLVALNGAVPVDLAIAVDCGDEPRMGAVGQAVMRANLPLVNLDHHRTNTLFGQANLVDLRTVAAAEGVLDWLDHLGARLSPTSAFCLLTGLVTDTLCFRTGNVTDVTLGKAQRLMTYGASLAEIAQRTVNRKSYGELRLWSVVMPTIQLVDRVIWVVITRELYEQADYPEADDAGLVSTLVQADEADIAVVFKEKPDRAVEIGIRAVPGFDTSLVAVDLGGGGHAAASGATVNEPLATLVPRVVGMLQDVARQGSALVR